MASLLPEPFRAGTKTTALRAPLNQMREAVAHCLTDLIRTGPGLVSSRRGHHYLIAATGRGGAGGAASAAPRLVTGTILTTYPTVAQMKGYIVTAYSDGDGVSSYTPKLGTDLVQMVLGTVNKMDYRITATDGGLGGSIGPLSETLFEFVFEIVTDAGTAEEVTTQYRASGYQKGMW